MERGSWKRHAGPVAVWLAAVAAFALLVAGRGGDAELVGLARGRVVHVAAPVTGRIAEMLVQPAQPVRRGQTIARLDDSVVARQIDALQAESRRLEAEHAEARSVLDAESRHRSAERSAEERSFEAGVADLDLRILELETELASERALLAGLREERRILVDGARDGLVSRLDTDRAIAAHEASAARVAALERHLERARAERVAAAARTDRFGRERPAPPSAAVAEAHLRATLAAQRALIDELEALREQHVLRAPCDGVVVDLAGTAGETATLRAGEGVVRRAGEVVAAGEPVVAVAETGPSEIVAWVHEGANVALRPGEEVRVAPAGAPRRVVTTRVVAVHPVVERLPERLWRAPGMPAWGRPVVLAVPPDLGVRPGERVHGWRR